MRFATHKRGFAVSCQWFCKIDFQTRFQRKFVFAQHDLNSKKEKFCHNTNCWEDDQKMTWMCCQMRGSATICDKVQIKGGRRPCWRNRKSVGSMQVRVQNEVHQTWIRVKHSFQRPPHECQFNPKLCFGSEFFTFAHQTHHNTGKKKCDSVVDCSNTGASKWSIPFMTQLIESHCSRICLAEWKWTEVEDEKFCHNHDGLFLSAGEDSRQGVALGLSRQWHLTMGSAEQHALADCSGTLSIFVFDLHELHQSPSCWKNCRLFSLFVVQLMWNAKGCFFPSISCFMCGLRRWWWNPPGNSSSSRLKIFTFRPRWDACSFKTAVKADWWDPLSWIKSLNLIRQLKKCRVRSTALTKWFF